MRNFKQSSRLFFFLLLFAIAGCGEEEELRKVSMSDLQMDEDGKYSYKEEVKPFTGIATVTKDGELVSESEFVSGDREGEHKVWWPETGKMRSLSTYVDGFMHGTMTTWNEDGVKLSEATYKDGALDGPFTAWFESGALSESGAYKSGKRDGLWTTFFDDPEQTKKLEEVTYEAGKLNGQKQIWLANGQLIYQGEYKNDQMDGRHEAFFETGVKRESGTYVDGRPTGVHEGWYESGQQEYKRYYREDGSPPAEEFWDRDGNKSDGAPESEPPSIP